MTRDQIAADLRWFFRHADGDMGLRSNFSAMVAGMKMTYPKPLGYVEPPHLVHVRDSKSSPAQVEFDDRAIEAARRAREIREALDLVPVWARVALGIAYKYGDGETRLQAAMIASAEEHRRSRSKRGLREWLERARTAKDSAKKRSWALLRENARVLLDRARDEFGRVAETKASSGARAT